MPVFHVAARHDGQLVLVVAGAEARMVRVRRGLVDDMSIASRKARDRRTFLRHDIPVPARVAARQALLENAVGEFTTATIHRSLMMRGV
jgi:phage head maturation protease